MAKQAVFDLSKLSDNDLVKMAKAVIREVERRLESKGAVIDNYANYRDCSIEYTWVYNKYKKKYYYYYLKCKSGKPKSIYIHNKPLLESLIMKYKSLKMIYRLKRKTMTQLAVLQQALDNTLVILGAAEQLEQAINETINREAKLLKHVKR